MTKGGDTEQTMAKHLILEWADGRCREPQGWCAIVTCGTGQTPTDPRRTWQDNSTHNGVHQQNQDTRPRRITVAKRMAVIMAFFNIYEKASTWLLHLGLSGKYKTKSVSCPLRTPTMVTFLLIH